jgi:SAM-dependent methyltransferase
MPDLKRLAATGASFERAVSSDAVDAAIILTQLHGPRRSASLHMTLSEAVELIRPAVNRAEGSWADLGAGSGLFSRALASLLGPNATVYAIDSDTRAMLALQSLSGRRTGGARITPIEADFRQLERIGALVRTPLDGVLFANALHFVPDPDRVLRDAGKLLGHGGRIVIVEYDGRPANRWVPFPIPLARLREIAAALSLRAPSVIGERPSDYGGIMYCAVLDDPASRSSVSEAHDIER